jgi:hypothetical protein
VNVLLKAARERGLQASAWPSLACRARRAWVDRALSVVTVETGGHGYVFPRMAGRGAGELGNRGASFPLEAGTISARATGPAPVRQVRGLLERYPTPVRPMSDSGLGLLRR